MKTLSARQTRELDAFTIEHEPIPCIELMERASTVFAEWFCECFPEQDIPVWIFCGTGNNGGDGLAVARLLHGRGYSVTVRICRFSESGSDDFQQNLKRAAAIADIRIEDLRKGDSLPVLPAPLFIIDAIFGSGLNRPVTGYWADLFDHINRSGATVAAIDIPSGLFADRPTTSTTILARRTLTFELPKLAFLFPENQEAVGEWTYRSIGLSGDFLEQVVSSYLFVDQGAAARMLRKRHKFDHKGTFGHALLIAGSYGKVGAATLSARAALRSGLGLLTIHAPRCAYEILQISVPEAMVSSDRQPDCVSEWPSPDPYRVIGLGPGIGQDPATREAVLQLIEKAEVPLVIDADGLNILARHPEVLAQLPDHSVLTPHPKEFERLFGKTGNSFERMELQRAMAQRYRLVVVLKGAHTCIALPDGRCFFNATGNPGMATGGSGDVLTGIITGLAAQGYTPATAAILGVYLHGLAGDLAATELGYHALVAGDLIRFLGKAFSNLSKQ